MAEERFGKYRLVRKLAQGGMAEIFLAKSVGVAGFEKTLIVKRILRELCQRHRFVRMFVNEAKVTSLLSHSNVVQVFDFGRVGNDYFIAMEFVDGKDLRSILHVLRDAGAPMSVELALYIIIGVLRGLEYAHDRGVIHRDVSPQNVLVSWEGEVKLADFGIAKVEQWTSLTRAGEVKGNFGYMAPEQAGAAQVGPQADLYSVGVTLYELLTLQNPFSKGGLPDVVRRIREHQPVAPSFFNGRVSPGLDALVLRAIAKRPQDRFPNATSMIAALSDELYPTSLNLSAMLSQLLRSLFDVSKPALEVPSAGPRVFAKRSGFAESGDPIPGLWQEEPTHESNEESVPPTELKETRVVTRSESSKPEVSSASISMVRDHTNLGRLRLYIAPRAVEVFIDDHLLHTGAPVEIQTSAHVVHRLGLRAPGYDAFETTFTLTAGEVRNLSIVLAGRRWDSSPT